MTGQTPDNEASLARRLWIYQRERIPFWSKLGSAIPRCDRAAETQHKANDTEHNSMLDMPIRREPGRDVTAGDSVNDAINQRQ